MQDLTKKFYLQVVETAPQKYVAKFLTKETGSMIVVSPGEIMTTQAPACSNSVAPFHGEQDFPTYSVGVSDHVLNLEIAASKDQLLLKFKYVGKDRLQVLPGGMDILLNNMNLA